MLSKIVRPSRTVFTMVEKLSSCSNISADSLATSVPLPIATPIAAFLSAGASFTPSPVIDATLPIFFRVSTMRTFCSGNTLAYTLTSFTILSNSWSLRFSRSDPVRATIFSSSVRLISRAIATAVSL